MVFVGGQVASSQGNEILGLGDYEVQGELAMHNVAFALTAAEAPVKDLAQLSVYIVDNTPDRQKAVLEGLGRAAADMRLRRTAMKIIGVQSLGSPDALVEIDAIAVTDSPLSS
jgi:enamine deaminase RidA (YjgF/YER057c/UK114 family)